MITKVKIIQVKEFLSFSPQGKMDLLKFKECINELSTGHGLFVDYNLLIDTRGAETHLKVFELWDLAKELATVIHVGSHKGFRAKIAIVCPVDEFDQAEFFKLCASNRGLNVRAFTSFEELFEWLSTASVLDIEKS